MGITRTIEEKNEIVRKYLSGEVGWQNTLRNNGISSHSVLGK